MSCFDGFPLPPRDEDGDEWEEGEGNLEFLPDGDAWHEAWPGEGLAGPEYWLNKDESDDGA